MAKVWSLAPHRTRAAVLGPARRSWLVCLTAAAAACGSPSGPTETDPSQTGPTEVSDNGTTEYSGQTGSIGSVECSTDEDCAVLLEDTVARLAEPRTFSATLEATGCADYVGLNENGEVLGPSCECRRSDSGGTIQVGPSGMGCAVAGRMGDCLYDSSEFAGCTVDDPDSCDDVCSEVEARTREDAEAELDYELRYAACAEHYCDSVARLGEACYTGLTMGTPTGVFHCSLSDEEILALDRTGTK